jgi:hypothetical protein
MEIGRGDQHSIAEIAVVWIDEIDKDRRVEDGVLHDGRIAAVAAIGIPLRVIGIAARAAVHHGTASMPDLRNDDVVAARDCDCCAVLGRQHQRHVAGSIAVIGAGHDRDSALDVILDNGGVTAVTAIGYFGLAGSIGADRAAVGCANAAGSPVGEGV